MAAEKCPLCQSRLKNGECESCGYRIPNEDNISAYYNYDPSDYPQEQPAVREITPEVQMEEIYPGRPEPIDFKVRNDEGKTVKSPYTQNNGGYGQSGQQGQQGQNYGQYGQYRQNGQYGSYQGQQTYYRNNGQYGQYRRSGQYGGYNNQNQQNRQQPYNMPYYRNNGQYGNYPQNGQYGGYNQNNQPYYRNNGGYQYYGNNSQGMGSSGKRHKKTWLLPLVTFLFPFPIGLIIFAIVSVLLKSGSTSVDLKYRNLILTTLILGFIFSPFKPFF